MKTLNDLVAEYTRFCEREQLPDMSADELIYEDVTPVQRRYLSDFIERWQQVERRDRELQRWRKTRVTLTPAEALQKHPRDLDAWEFGEHDKQVHVYDDWGLFGIIVERDNGDFAWCFSHPCDSIAPTLAEAESELYDFLYA